MLFRWLDEGGEVRVWWLRVVGEGNGMVRFRGEVGGEVVFMGYWWVFLWVVCSVTARRALGSMAWTGSVWRWAGSRSMVVYDSVRGDIRIESLVRAGEAASC